MKSSVSRSINWRFCSGSGATTPSMNLISMIGILYSSSIEQDYERGPHGVLRITFLLLDRQNVAAQQITPRADHVCSIRFKKSGNTPRGAALASLPVRSDACDVAKCSSKQDYKLSGPPWQITNYISAN